MELNSPVVYIFKGNWLRTEAPEDLEEICRQIIADFNDIYLEEDRISFQEMINNYNRIMLNR